MRILQPALTAIVLLAALFGVTPCASAAESYDNCTGFIDTLPATITSQGVWCLRQDLSTSSTNVNAIDIQTNDVTIDCNGFKLGNLAAGTGTQSYGVHASGTLANVTVRHCIIQGFYFGIYIYSSPGVGHLIEDNRLWLSRYAGLSVIGTGGVIVRRNQIINTGGGTGLSNGYGIIAVGDIIDNVVDGISAAAGVAYFGADGIDAYGVGSLVRGNRVRNLAPLGGYQAYGIFTEATGVWVRDNAVVQGSSTSGYGIYCSTAGYLSGNLVGNYTTDLSSCHDAGGNATF